MPAPLPGSPGDTAVEFIRQASIDGTSWHQIGAFAFGSYELALADYQRFRGMGTAGSPRFHRILEVRRTVRLIENIYDFSEKN